MPSFNTIKSKISDIHGQVQKFYSEVDKEISAVQNNKDFTDLARNKKVEELKRKKAKFYRKKMQEKSAIITEADDKLRRSVYSGKNSSDLAFDEAARKFSKAKTDGELLDVVNSKPSNATLRAVAKAAVISDRPNFKVLRAAAEVNSNIANKVNELESFHREWGSLEPTDQKMKRKVFGDHSSA